MGPDAPSGEGDLISCRVAYERQLLAVRRPRRNIDRPLTAIDVGNHFRLATLSRREPQVDAPIEGMVLGIHVTLKREKSDLLSVRRKVRKPIIELIVGDLLVLGAVRPDSPDLHRAAARGVEVDVLPIRRILSPVVV